MELYYITGQQTHQSDKGGEADLQKLLVVLGKDVRFFSEGKPKKRVFLFPIGVVSFPKGM